MLEKGKRTKYKIVQAASKLFITQAISKTSVATICKEAGVAKGTFYIYFESKDDLVWHFIETEFFEIFQLFDSIERYDFDNDSIQHVVSLIISFINDNTGLIHRVHNQKFLEYFTVDELKHKLEYRLLQPLSKWFSHGMELGYFIDTDPLFLSQFIFYGGHEIIDHSILRQSPFSMKEIQHNLTTIIQQIIKK